MDQPRPARTRAGRHRPVHVMHVVTTLGLEGRTGGMEYGVIKLANSLDPATIRTSICSTYEADPAITRLLDPAVAYFDCGRTPGNDIRWVLRMRRLFRRERPDIVHTHTWGTLVEGLVAARLAGVRTVIHGEHGTTYTKPHQLRAQRWAWKMASRVLAVSSRLADRLSKEVGFPRERIHVIRNGVDLVRFDPARRTEGRRLLGLADEDLCIGAVGRLLPVKDHANLVAALVRCRTAGLRFRAFVAGDGPLRPELERSIADGGIADCATILGHRSDVEAILPAFDIFVLPSKSEGLSNTIQESLACGVPVVATAVGGADEMVADGVNGLLVPPSDTGALAEGIVALAGDPARRQEMARANRLRAQREFGMERMLDEYRRLYLDLA